MARKVLPKRKTKRDTTPKIVYLTGILAYGAWFGWGYILLKLSPDSLPNRLLFLGGFFLALFLTFLFLFYQTGKILTSKSPSVVFYPAVRRALLVGGFFFLLGIMKLLGIFTLINAGLFGLILLLIEIQISRG